MSNSVNTNLKELQREWLEEDLYRILVKTRLEPGISLEDLASVIKDALGDDINNLIKELNK